MRIAKYISDLLFEYECIVIPGFGGFITNEIPAQINSTQNSFNPPSKKIVFNVHLRTNDGLLINHISKLENISYRDAKARVDGFVSKCHEALDNGKRIHFHKIGIIEKDNQENLLFEPDKSQNYLPGSFGLTSFYSPPIKRDTIFRTEKKFTDRKPQKSKQPTPKESIKKEKKPRYISINIFGLLLTIGIVLLFYFNFGAIRNFYNNYGSTIPFFYSTPNEYLIFNWGTKTLPKIAKNKLNKSDEDKQVIQNDQALNDNNQITESSTTSINKDSTMLESPKKQDPEISNQTEKSNLTDVKKEEEQPDNKDKFYIIAGSFRNETNAHKLVGQLIKKGFDAAIIGRNKYGYYRVCYVGYNTRGEADKRLEMIRDNENASAWIYAMN